MRTTRKQVEGTFERFAEASGIPNLILCHEAGGYIVRQEGPGSGQSDVFGSTLRPAGEMWDTLHFAIQLLAIQRQLAQ